MLDFDLAELYNIQTRVLKQAVRRNLSRFPDDFMLRIPVKEANQLLISGVSQIVTPLVITLEGQRCSPSLNKESLCSPVY